MSPTRYTNDGWYLTPSSTSSTTNITVSNWTTGTTIRAQDLDGWYNNYSYGSRHDRSGPRSYRLPRFKFVDKDGNVHWLYDAREVLITQDPNQDGYDIEVKVDHLGDVPVVKRSPPPRAFNPYVNASDLMERFIDFLGEHDVRQGEVMDLPVGLFIQWLILQACEADGDEVPQEVREALPAGWVKGRPQPRCRHCGKFMRKDALTDAHDACVLRVQARLIANQITPALGQFADSMSDAQDAIMYAISSLMPKVSVGSKPIVYSPVV